MTCSNENESHVKNKLVISLEKIFIKLSTGAKIMELAHTQPKLFATEHAQGRKLQTEKIAFEVRGSAVLLIFHLLLYSKPLPSRAYCQRYVLQVVYCGYRNIIRVFSNVSLRRSGRFYLFTGSECACVRSFKPIRGPL